MKRPKQLPAVERNITRSASAPVGGHLGPSSFWSTLGDVAKVAVPTLLSFA
jgi:hypothetical protein